MIIMTLYHVLEQKTCMYLNDSCCIRQRHVGLEEYCLKRSIEIFWLQNILHSIFSKWHSSVELSNKLVLLHSAARANCNNCNINHGRFVFLLFSWHIFVLFCLLWINWESSAFSAAQRHTLQYQDVCSNGLSLIFDSYVKFLRHSRWLSYAVSLLDKYVKYLANWA